MSDTLVQFLMENLPGADARHDGEGDAGRVGPEIWRAQVDAFASRLYARFTAVAAEEMSNALGQPLCLHKLVAGLHFGAEAINEVAGLLAGMLMAEADDEEEEDDEAPPTVFPRDEWPL